MVKTPQLNLPKASIRDPISHIPTLRSEYCSDINSIILEVLAPGTSDDEAKVFYHKMAGDYYR